MMILPRFIRYRDAPAYLGVDRGRFDNEIRPFLIEIPIGERGIAFDRLDLDEYADEYKRRNGRLSRNSKVITCEQGQKEFNLPLKTGGLLTKSTEASGYLLDSEKLVKTKLRHGYGKNKPESTSNLSKARNAISQLLQEDI